MKQDTANAAEEPESEIFTFARTFSEAEHAKAFLRGHVRMQTIEYFQGLEATEKALRGDAYEGLSAIFQPSSISEIVIAGMPLLPQHLARPISIHNNAVKPWHVFCLHTIGVTGEDPRGYESLEDMRKALLLDEQVHPPWAACGVFLRTTEFPQQNPSSDFGTRLRVPKPTRQILR